MSDFLRFFEGAVVCRDLPLVAGIEGGGGGGGSAAAGSGLTSGIGSGTGGGGEHEGMEESGDMEVISTEGERARRDEA
jgi:hypothetical protein